MKAEQRTLGDVPALAWIALAAALAVQIAWRAAVAPAATAAADLPSAPTASSLRLAALRRARGARAAVPCSICRPTTTAAATPPPTRAWTTRGSSAGWARSSRSTRAATIRSSPRRASTRRTPDPARSRAGARIRLPPVSADPDRRWPSLAHAALIAKHRLNDLPLARRYAAAIERYTRSPDVPLWARQMEIFILEDMNELEAARILLGGLLESGSIQRPRRGALPAPAPEGARGAHPPVADVEAVTKLSAISTIRRLAYVAAKPLFD